MMPKEEDPLLLIEKELMAGRGKWIADFTESKRSFKLGGITFDLLIRGGTKVKGFLLSRILSYFVSPNYLVACFIYKAKEGSHVDRTLLQKMLGTIKKFMEKEELHWSWLIVLQQRYPEPLKKFVNDLGSREVGVVLYDVGSREISYNSPLGKQMAKHVFPKALLKRR